MVEDRIALIGGAIIERQPKQVGMVFKLRGQVKAELAAKEQLIVMDGEWIAKWQTRNRFIQSVCCHSDDIDGGQKVGELPRFISGIITIQVQSCDLLCIGIAIGGL